MTTPESSSPAPTPPVAERSPGLIAVAALVVCGFVGGVLVAALLARQTRHDLDQLRTSVSTLQQDLERFRENSKALAVASDRDVLLTFSDTGFHPVRTNGGTLLVALGDVSPLQNAVIVQLRVGNPQSVTYEGFALTLEWDKHQSEEKFEQLLEPGQWKTVQATLKPADPAAIKAVRIVAASVNQIRVQQ